ncbi:MAG: TraR/DksA family transcriptional regulator [Henriciella sp.]|nr:TraR/DksA family transcriptional regulator [Henriciella sp.]
MKRFGSKSADLATALGGEHDRILVPKTVNPDGCPQPNPLSGLSSDTALAQIEAALKRLETGDYGICISCGAQISLERLEADPSVADCGNCMSGDQVGV